MDLMRHGETEGAASGLLEDRFEARTALAWEPGFDRHFRLCGRMVGFQELSRPAFKIDPVHYVTAFWEEA